MYLFNAIGVSSDWWNWLYYISASIAGLIMGMIYAFASLDRFPITGLHLCLIGGCWALGWMMIAHSSFSRLAGILGGALIALITLVSWRKQASWRQQ
jgi:hypothetical protein